MRRRSLDTPRLRRYCRSEITKIIPTKQTEEKLDLTGPNLLLRLQQMLRLRLQLLLPLHLPLLLAR